MRLRWLTAHPVIVKTKHTSCPVPLTPGLLMTEWLKEEGGGWDLRSSPTCRISQSILVSSMALRPKGHSCLSSRLLFSKTIWGEEGRVDWGGRQGGLGRQDMC